MIFFFPTRKVSSLLEGFPSVKTQRNHGKRPKIKAAGRVTGVDDTVSEFVTSTLMLMRQCTVLTSTHTGSDTAAILLSCAGGKGEDEARLGLSRP